MLELPHDLQLDSSLVAEITKLQEDANSLTTSTYAALLGLGCSLLDLELIIYFSRYRTQSACPIRQLAGASILSDLSVRAPRPRLCDQAKAQLLSRIYQRSADGTLAGAAPE